MIPVEVREPTLRLETLEEDNANERRVDLDLLPEVREAAHVREFACKLDASSNKLTPNWDGPFRVLEEVGRGAFILEELEGRQVPRTWNLANLRFYYS
ncbi:Transposon Ty3-I Gag-Pol polyprotein [Sesbania bispinosa]|nr:Transposon Ty3-I Gag-Pol polyprotein [Sesbania bispinosa]